MRDEYRKCTHIKKSMKGHKAYDEYYTTAGEIRFIFTQLIDTEQLRNKVVYCPCDSDESEFVKWLQSHKDEYGIKEVIHTHDDLTTHDDLFKKADIVITNPPFSIIHSEILPRVKKYECKFFLFGSITSIDRYINAYDGLSYIKRPNFYFVTPHINETTGDYFTMVQFTLYLTNMKHNDLVIYNFSTMLNTKAEDHSLRVICNTGEILAIDKSREIPYDYDGLVAVPLTFAIRPEISQFDIIMDKSIKFIRFNDGKSRFKRLIIKRKPEYVGMKYEAPPRRTCDYCKLDEYKYVKS